MSGTPINAATRRKAKEAVRSLRCPACGERTLGVETATRRPVMVGCPCGWFGRAGAAVETEETFQSLRHVLSEVG